MWRCWIGDGNGRKVLRAFPSREEATAALEANPVPAPAPKPTKAPKAPKPPKPPKAPKALLPRPNRPHVPNLYWLGRGNGRWRARCWIDGTRTDKHFPASAYDEAVALVTAFPSVPKPRAPRAPRAFDVPLDVREEPEDGVDDVEVKPGIAPLYSSPPIKLQPKPFVDPPDGVRFCVHRGCRVRAELVREPPIEIPERAPPRSLDAEEIARLSRELGPRSISPAAIQLRRRMRLRQAS